MLGQVASPVAFDDLKLRLADVNENPMVRHECAEALGSIATPESTEVLREFLSDPERIVFESCQVALDMTDYETSGDFHLSDALLVSS